MKALIDDCALCDSGETVAAAAAAAWAAAAQAADFVFRAPFVATHEVSAAVVEAAAIFRLPAALPAYAALSTQPPCTDDTWDAALSLLVTAICCAHTQP